MPEHSRSGATMKWTTVQHLDLPHSGGRRGASARPMQPHAAAFSSSQAIVAVAIGTHVVEFDALTGSKIASIELVSRVVRMAYSPTTSHAVIAILEDATIRSCDFATEQTLVLHSPEKKTDHVSIDTEVHLALTPLEPIVYFGFHKRMNVTVVGTVDGGRLPTKIRTDLKKPIVNLAFHPCLPVLYVAYAEGLIRAYNSLTYAVHYTLKLDSRIKLIGAGAIGFHPTLEWMFVGDRCGTLLAWDVSTERPSLIGITQVSSQPIISVSWLPTLQLLVTICKDGALQVWKTQINPNIVHFFERTAVETMDITKILTLQDGEAVYPLPRIKNLAVHPKFNLAAVIFADMSGSEAAKNKAAYTREGRRQLFALLQGAWGSTGNCSSATGPRSCCAQCEGGNGRAVSAPCFPAHPGQAQDQLHQECHQAEHGGPELRLRQANAGPSLLQGAPDEAGRAQEPDGHVRAEGPDEQVHRPVQGPLAVLLGDAQPTVDHQPRRVQPLRCQVFCALSTCVRHLWHRSIKRSDTIASGPGPVQSPLGRISIRFPPPPPL